MLDKILRFAELLVALAILAFAVATALFVSAVVSPAQAAELRVEHTSRYTGRVITNVQFVVDCRKARRTLLSRAIGRMNFWCDGRMM